MATRLKKWQVNGFTLIESLVTLAVSVFLVMSVSGAVTGIYQQMQESLFFTSFESFYRHSQKLSNSSQAPIDLIITPKEVISGDNHLAIPATISVAKAYTVSFNRSGGNSSLQKIQFQCQGKIISYQLYIGSGRYQKSIS